MTRLRVNEARSIVTEELERVGWQTESTFTVQTGARPEADRLAWWHKRTPGEERADTDRSLAYLRAYNRIAGNMKVYACGIFLETKRLWMDRSVMSRLERDGYVTFEGEGKSEPWFELTAKGQDWIA